MNTGINILLIFPDQWRPDWNPANAAVPLKLPHWKQMLAQGTNFTKAITSSPLCAPSRACFALGTEYEACPVKNNEINLPLGADTFYARLRAAGYHVMACGKMDLAKIANDWGIDGQHQLRDGTTKIDQWGFSAAVDNSGKEDGYNAAKTGNLCPYTHFLKDHSLLQVHFDDFAQRRGPNTYHYTAPTPLPDFAYCDNFEAEQGLSLLHQAPAGKPWFLQVNFSGPHNPEDVTKGMWEPWQKTDFPAPVKAAADIHPDAHTSIRRDYAAMLENIDRWIGIFRQEIERRGETDRTLVVFSSDHGEMLGDHSHWGKMVPFQASMGVPLTMVGPGVKAGAENHAPVSLLDVAATFLDLSGAGNGPKFQDGHSLAQVLKGEAGAVRKVAVSGLGKWRAAFDGQWKLIRGFDTAKTKRAAGKKEAAADDGGVAGAGQKANAAPADLLFDLNADPNELVNVSAAHPDIVARLSPYLANPAMT